MKYLQYSILIVFCLWIQSLLLNGQMTLYVHPRYIMFTVVMSVIALIMSTIAIFHDRGISDIISFRSIRMLGVSGVLLIFVAVIAILLPPKALGSKTIDIRGYSADWNNFTSFESEENPFFTIDTQNLELGDWIKQFRLNEPSHFEGKEVNVTGFIHRPKELVSISNEFQTFFKLSRFAVTCCAVDARPVGIASKVSANIMPNFNILESSWVRVRGKLGVELIGGASSVVIIVEEITQISEPKDPYIY